MPKLVTPDGGEMDENEVNRAFAEAMAAPEPDEETHPGPKRKDPENKPEERAEPQEKPADTKARTRASSGSSGRQKARRGGAKRAEPNPAPAEGVFVRPVAEFLEGAVIGATFIPFPAGDLRTKVRLQAALVNEHTAGIAAAVDAAARHNATIRKGVEALTMGSAGWVLPAVMAVAPFAMQSLNLWKSEVVPAMAEQAAAFEESVKAHIQNAAGQANDQSAAA